MSENVNKKLRLLIPLILFIALIPIFFFAIGEDDKESLPSPLIGKTMPEFLLSSLDGTQVYDRKSILGEPFILNVWGSWCPSCIFEHPYLKKLSEQGVKIVGVNYKDTREKANKFINELGNPYSIILFDSKGELGLELGVYGAPESYLVSASGEILYKRVGVIDERIWKEQIEPIYNKISAKNSSKRSEAMQ